MCAPSCCVLLLLFKKLPRPAFGKQDRSSEWWSRSCRWAWWCARWSWARRHSLPGRRLPWSTMFFKKNEDKFFLVLLYLITCPKFLKIDFISNVGKTWANYNWRPMEVVKIAGNLALVCSLISLGRPTAVQQLAMVRRKTTKELLVPFA